MKYISSALGFQDRPRLSHNQGNLKVKHQGSVVRERNLWLAKGSPMLAERIGVLIMCQYQNLETIELGHVAIGDCRAARQRGTLEPQHRRI